MFGELFPGMGKAIVVEDPRTRAVAGERVIALLKAAGIEVAEHIVNPDGSDFHATYAKVEEVREAIAASVGAVPIAVGSGTLNDLTKRASDELGRRYMVVGTAASMDGYTAANAAITKDGMKQTMNCKAPLGCIVDSPVAAAAPKDMTASGYADLIAKIPAGADWLIADAIGSRCQQREHLDVFHVVDVAVEDVENGRILTHAHLDLQIVGEFLLQAVQLRRGACLRTRPPWHFRRLRCGDLPPS